MGRRLHDLRHTAACLWLARGVDLNGVSAWLVTPRSAPRIGICLPRNGRRFGRFGAAQPGSACTRRLPAARFLGGAKGIRTPDLLVAKVSPVPSADLVERVIGASCASDLCLTVAGGTQGAKCPLMTRHRWLRPNRSLMADLAAVVRASNPRPAPVCEKTCRSGSMRRGGHGQPMAQSMNSPPSVRT